MTRAHQQPSKSTVTSRRVNFSRLHNFRAGLFCSLIAPATLVACVELDTEDHGPGVEDRKLTSVSRPIALATGIIYPATGVDPKIQPLQKSNNVETAIVIAQRGDTPNPAHWDGKFKQAGVERLAYLGDSNWILRITLEPKGNPQQKKKKNSNAPVTNVSSLEHARNQFGASSFTMLDPSYKIAPGLGKSAVVPSNINYKSIKTPISKKIAVEVLFFKGASNTDVQAGLALGTSVEAQGGSWYRMQLNPADVVELATHQEVHMIAPSLEGLPLMSDARKWIGVDPWHDLDTSVTPLPSAPPSFGGISGRDIRVSTNESFDQDNDDFWNHDFMGNRTTPRWEAGVFGGGSHGTMTGGILMGNGWNSEAAGGEAFEYRGIAPDAIYCNGNADPDVENHSFTQPPQYYSAGAASSDTRIYDPTHPDHHAHVGSAGNEGYSSQYATEIGYYSLWRDSKNEIIVQNMASNTLSLNGGSLGPTWDGRIKPDIAAPGHATKFPTDVTSLEVELDYVEVDAASGLLRWDFNSSGAGWNEGWGEQGDWWSLNNFSVPVAEGTSGVWSTSYPWGSGWAYRPRMGAHQTPAGAPMLLSPGSGDSFTIRYRIQDPHWDGTGAYLQWNDTVDYYVDGTGEFTVQADGQWHTATVDLGGSADWTSLPQVSMVSLLFGGPNMAVPAHGSQGYGGASGTSAAGPVVAGVYALMTEVFRDSFGTDLLDDLSPSAFWQGPGGPGAGVVIPSTYKAVAIHTAQDLAAVHVATEQDNPDTGEPVVYHRGPDYVTGYGLVDGGEALTLLESELQAGFLNPSDPYHHIVEDEITTAAGQSYTFEVPAGQRRTAATLAWDDPPPSPLGAATVGKLVNNLDLLLLSPSGVWHKPWSLDLPYVPTAADEPGVAGPEPVTQADFVPARRDISNQRDNLERVDVEFPEAGTWTAFVLGSSLADPDQRFSLVMGDASREVSTLEDGTVLFVSDRLGTPQVFTKTVGSSVAPRQLTDEPFAVRHPTLSWNGEYVAYITHDPGTGADVLVVRDIAGNLHGSFPAGAFGVTGISYPRWSRQGDRISVMKFDTWSARGLDVLEFAGPYDMSSGSLVEVVPLGTGASDLDPNSSVFSPSGRHLYFSASNNQFTAALHSIRLDGTGLRRLMGDGGTFQWAFAPSLSPDGRHMLFNSESYRDDPVTFVDEEMVELDVLGGVLRQQTKEDGHQYGYFAKNGTGEWIMQTNTVPGGDSDLVLVDGDAREALDVDDPGNVSSEYSPNWVKGPLPLRRLRHEATGKCLYSTGAGASGDVRNWGCWDDPNMGYMVDDMGAGKVMLRHLRSGGCIDVSTINGMVAANSVCDAGNPGQLFTLVDLGGGEVRVESDLGYCLYGNPLEGGMVSGWACWNDPNMVFTLESVL